MRGASGLRHQLITDQQRDVFDYWTELSGARGGALPRRSDIDPARIARQLPFISIFQRGTCGRHHIRLAGTGFWNFYHTEITGAAVDDLPIGEARSYWNRVLDHVGATLEPMASTTRPHTPSGAHLSQHWLRLPLAPQDGESEPLVLGFDQFMHVPDDTKGMQPITSRLMRPVFGTGAPLLVPA